jgi:hypothetical protein
LISPGLLRGSGFHDAKQAFSLNHGQAARQNLESCVSCHAERDCLTCHSSLGGRRFNPHGPGFDGAMVLRFQNLLLRKNFIPISHRLHRVDISLISQLQNHLEVT